MKAHRQIALHQSIEEPLHEPGCPFCRFLPLVTENGATADHRPGCDVCHKLTEEEARRIRELVTQSGEPDVARWPRMEQSFVSALIANEQSFWSHNVVAVHGEEKC